MEQPDGYILFLRVFTMITCFVMNRGFPLIWQILKLRVRLLGLVEWTENFLKGYINATAKNIIFGCYLEVTIYKYLIFLSSVIYILSSAPAKQLFFAGAPILLNYKITN